MGEAVALLSKLVDSSTANVISYTTAVSACSRLVDLRQDAEMADKLNANKIDVRTLDDVLRVMFGFRGGDCTVMQALTRAEDSAFSETFVSRERLRQVAEDMQLSDTICKDIDGAAYLQFVSNALLSGQSSIAE